MYLNSIFKNGPCIDIKQLSCNSKEKMQDAIYFCIKGVKYDGHDYIDEAINNGAKVIVYSNDIDVNDSAFFIKVNDVETTLMRVADIFYDYPCKKLETYVICGNNGRSSVLNIINHILSKKKKCSSIGIMGINNDGSIKDTRQPTLPILENYKYFNDFVKSGCEVCSIEATALSLSYRKLDMVKPKCFIYTTTCFESSSYQELGNEYYNEVKRYLQTIGPESNVVLNYDDPSFMEFKKVFNECVSYGMNKGADYLISEVKLQNDCSSFVLSINDEEYMVHTKLLGLVNVYNISAALSSLHRLGYDLNEMIINLRDLDCIDGVMDKLNYKDYNIYVDCAYTIDSYNRVLKFADRITDSNNKIVSLISINSTDTKSRIKDLMKFADKYADQIILTSDDAFEGDLSELLNLAYSYVKSSSCIIIEDREGAIEESIELLNKNDTLLILGKGNENFVYRGLVKKKYSGDKNLTYKYMKKRLTEESKY